MSKAKVIEQLVDKYYSWNSTNTTEEDFRKDISSALDTIREETERKYCKFIGVETTDGKRWCKTHDKWEDSNLKTAKGGGR